MHFLPSEAVEHPLYRCRLYPVDRSRVNEFGESFEERPQQKSHTQWALAWAALEPLCSTSWMVSWVFLEASGEFLDVTPSTLPKPLSISHTSPESRHEVFERSWLHLQCPQHEDICLGHWDIGRSWSSLAVGGSQQRSVQCWPWLCHHHHRCPPTWRTPEAGRCRFPPPVVCKCSLREIQMPLNPCCTDSGIKWLFSFLFKTWLF